MNEILLEKLTTEYHEEKRTFGGTVCDTVGK